MARVARPSAGSASRRSGPPSGGAGDGRHREQARTRHEQEDELAPAGIDLEAAGGRCDAAAQVGAEHDEAEHPARRAGRGHGLDEHVARGGDDPRGACGEEAETHQETRAAREEECRPPAEGTGEGHDRGRCRSEAEMPPKV